MNKRLTHRGPDDHGVVHLNHVTFGQQRLSIIDLTAGGHQPFTSPDGRYLMVFNGEIYNYRELRKELSYPFQTQSDTEVLLAAWITWGEAALQKLKGMFAFAVYDSLEGSIHIVRDRMGIKPLYYHFSGNRLVFSSEIRALMASGHTPRTLSHTGVVDYLRYQTVQCSHTIIEEVWMLEPGHLLHFTPHMSQPLKKQWWQLRVNEQQPIMDDETVKQEVRRLFFQAIERRLVADVPFGAFLSGGIDSSAVVGAMARVSSQKVKTFNISFAEEQFSEAKYARHIAQMHQTDHHEIRLTPEDFLHQLPDALQAMDHPSGDGPNTWLVSKATKEAGITMALSGTGGDELFAGYAIFNRMAALHGKQWLWNLPHPLRSLSGNLMRKLKPGVATDKMAGILGMPQYDFNRIYNVSRQVLADDAVANLLSPQGFPQGVGAFEHLPVAQLNHLDMPKDNILSAVSMAEMTTYMQNVLLRDADQMSMAHALEVRVPFLDHDLVEFVLSLPSVQKRPLTPKKLLVDAMPDLLPDYIVNRPKMGFVFPWQQWLKKDLYDLANTHIEQLAQNPLFNGPAVRNLWQQFLKGNPSVTYSRIWPLVVLGAWMRRDAV